VTSPATTALPLATGVWPVDVAHSGVHFSIRHLGVTNVRGRFGTFDSTLTVGESLADVVIEATIDMSSVDTNQPDRDTHLRSSDFFDVESHPTMTFRSTSIVDKGAGEYDMNGDLTINGVTRPVTLATEFLGTDVHPADGRTRAGFEATTEIRRGEFGITFNMPLGGDKLALSDKVKVNLDLQFIAP
jgi:polyisoprenoid-binding protein YceI